MKNLKILSDSSEAGKSINNSVSHETNSTVYPIKAFISYSHKDNEGRLALRTALSPLIQKNKLQIWDDRAIDVGIRWEHEIFDSLNQAKIVFCLVSGDFINSDFCNRELQIALNAHNNNEKIVIPIRFRSCFWDNLPLATLQGVPETWIMSEVDRDAAWTRAAKSIDELLKKIQQYKLDVMEEISETNKEITDEFNSRSLNNKYKDAVDWLANNKTALIDKIFSKLCRGKFPNNELPSDFPEEPSDIRTFKLHLTHFLESIEVCLLEDNAMLIEEPDCGGYNEEYYIEALNILKKRLRFSISISKESKEKLLYYIDYLIERI